MTNSVSLHEWIRVIDTEYLTSFIQAGGASVKFAVTPDDLRPELYTTVARRCGELDCLFATISATETRVHMPQDLFFKLADQIDWRLTARRMILKLAGEQGYRVRDIDARVAENVFDAIGRANDLDSRFVLGAIRPAIQNQVFKNTKMAKDFRVCMSHLCLQEDTHGGYDGQPLIDWLTGRNMRISGVRPFSIYSGINRTTARYFIESALYWIRHAGYSGTVVMLDSSRVTEARNPRDGLRYYTRPMTIEHYELLREFIDSIDRLTATLLIVVANNAFLDDGGERRSRGYGIYQALRTRVMDDVRDRNRVNPIAALVRLAPEEVAPEEVAP